MFISYFKGTPEYHILRFKNGKIREQGRGISWCRKRVRSVTKPRAGPKFGRPPFFARHHARL